jgi:hypothetical protein
MALLASPDVGVRRRALLRAVSPAIAPATPAREYFRSWALGVRRLLLILETDHPSARVDADLMSTTGVPSNTSIGPILIRVPLVAP